MVGHDEGGVAPLESGREPWWQESSIELEEDVRE
jgi:hypothetical protein